MGRKPRPPPLDVSNLNTHTPFATRNNSRWEKMAGGKGASSDKNHQGTGSKGVKEAAASEAASGKKRALM